MGTPPTIAGMCSMPSALTRGLEAIAEQIKRIVCGFAAERPTMTRACVQERLGRPATAAPLSANICRTRCEVRPQEISAERLSAGLEVLDAADGGGAGEQRLEFARVNTVRGSDACVPGSGHNAASVSVMM